MAAVKPVVKPQVDPEPTTEPTVEPKAKAEPKGRGTKVFRVTAMLVTVKDSNGTPRYLGQGDLIPDGTTQESIDHLVDLGYAAEEK